MDGIYLNKACLKGLYRGMDGVYTEERKTCTITHHGIVRRAVQFLYYLYL